jgi:hypothetical protein
MILNGWFEKQISDCSLYANSAVIARSSRPLVISSQVILSLVISSPREIDKLIKLFTPHDSIFGSHIS